MTLLSEAKDILEKNWRGDHTIPSSGLYPHQWSWDSAFISIGLSRYTQSRAQKELMSLFEGQWSNGMLPHILFRSNMSYFPGPDDWNSRISKNAPEMKTSGITQPAVHAIAALQVYRNGDDEKRAKKFLVRIFPKLLAFHRFLLTERDPEKSGLVTIFHPWESGFDNSLRWDEPISKLKFKNLPDYKRKDTDVVASEFRPSDEDYDRYFYLLEFMKVLDYDSKKIYKTIPFKVKDVVFSTITYLANKALLEMAEILEEDTKEIETWIKRTEKNYLKYFGEDGLVYDFDLVSKKRIKKRTAASLISLYSGLLDNKGAQEVIQWMKHSYICTEKCEHKHSVISSTSFKAKEFNPLNYWRGPVWINVNWMIYQGLRNHGFEKEAAHLKDAIIELVSEHGFYEYYNPLNSKGLGSNDFSWTASLVTDLLSE